jgi:hypothetical protein
MAGAIDSEHPNAPLDALIDHVIEPTARALGDAWMRDDIDAFTLTLALGRLNSFVHTRGLRVEAAPRNGRHILCATWPGEEHMTGPVAVAELFGNAGWTVDLEFPEDSSTLLRLAAGCCYDRIDIGSSDSFARVDVRAAAPALAAEIRAVSANPLVELSFGGRAFWADTARSRIDRCIYRASAASLRV